MRINIIEFIKSGTFGEINIGISKGELINLIGEPDQYSISCLSQSIYKFGNVQFTLNRDDKLSAIMISMDDEVWHKNFEIQGWQPITQFEKWKFMTQLEECSITFKIDEDLTFDNQETILSHPSMVRILFLDDILDKIYKFKETIKQESNYSRTKDSN